LRLLWAGVTADKPPYINEEVTADKPPYINEEVTADKPPYINEEVAIGISWGVG